MENNETWIFDWKNICKICEYSISSTFFSISFEIAQICAFPNLVVTRVAELRLRVNGFALLLSAEHSNGE